MASFLFWSDSGDGGFLAYRLKREGHQVRLYINDRKSKAVFHGLVEQISRPDPSPKDIIIFDMVKFGKQADQLRVRGIPVIGASRFADMIELKRGEGANLMRAFGIKVPETHTFKKIPDGISFLAKQDGTWFYKPSGNQDAGFTYGGDVDDLIRFMQYSGTKYKPNEFELQRKLDGTEISFEGWFDGKQFVYPFNSTIEDKKFLVGDKGPRTGCMANIVWAYDNPRPMLALKTLLRITPALEAARHVGPIDINTIIDDKGEPYGLEWSPRFGYDALQALSLLIPGDFGQQLEAFARQELPNFAVRDDVYALTLNVSVPPFPHYHIAHEVMGMPIDPRLLDSPNNVLLRDVMVVKGQLQMAGADGCVATIGDTGKDIQELRTRVMSHIDTFKIPNMQYRTDPVLRAEKTIASLESMGYEGPSV